MKRGVEMSLQTVVIAVILILIAAILIYMVGNGLKNANNTLGACEARSGQCLSDCRSGMQPYYLGNSECGEGAVCCIDGDDVLGGDR